MKLSNFNRISECVALLRDLQKAREMAQYNMVQCTVSHGDDTYHVAMLTSVGDVRCMIMRLLDVQIAEVKSALKNLEVQTDE